MRSIEARFKCYREKYSDLSDFIVLGRAIRGQRFNESAIRRWFYKLVDKGEYAPSDKQRLIKHLMDLNTPEEDKKQG